MLLPDRDRAELLGGRVVYKPMPSIAHGDAVIGIAGQLLVYVRGAKGYEPVDVAGRESVKPRAPFESVSFDARRVFLLTGMLRDESR